MTKPRILSVFLYSRRASMNESPLNFSNSLASVFLTSIPAEARYALTCTCEPGLNVCTPVICAVFERRLSRSACMLSYSRSKYGTSMKTPGPSSISMRRLLSFMRWP